ncbi:DoxX family membrane protein [Streptomyces sp. ODS05-4]|uniref:DoxX family membrane protein n=1 Tax=Streptomyces sp. ODS05-4 TaxID=2944939 RepID=UPI00210D79B0|nr:DoxX family membrane protein [Streptomyces sp. ODS05-4]
MSVDTRTPRPGFDDQPALSMVKVHCDPAQVIVNHASFRVKLAPAHPPRQLANTTRVPVFGAGATPVPRAGAPARRRAPVVWSGKSQPGDPGATGLLQAVRQTTAVPAAVGAADTGSTQLIPRVDLAGDLAGDTMPNPVVSPRRSPDAAPILPPMRRAVGAYDEQPAAPLSGPGHSGHDSAGYDERADAYEEARAAGAAPASHRHAYYPGRRMNLGVVLLPLRVFLGFISIYAGMGKLCDPVYFDGGERGSMVTWLTSLNPWPLAEPLRDFALAHPVGAGLTVAFAQVIVGVLTVCGLWQRFAAVIGAALSAALILTVSWKNVPVYEAPDFIFLAAWSPLVIAGAPVYSVDGRLAGEAWRTLGPRSDLRDLRRRVLRRGGIMAAVVVGLTLLVGSVLGGAVRSTQMVTVPGPDGDPVNHLPGQVLPREQEQRQRSSTSPDAATRRPEPTASTAGSPAAERSAEPTEDSAPEAEQDVAEQPTATQGAGEEAPRQSEPVPPPTTSAGPTAGAGSGGDGDFSSSTGGSGSGGGEDASSGGGSDGGGSSSGSSSGSSGGSGSGGGNSNPLGGLLG